MLLAGDIGGTKTHLALFASKDNMSSPVLEEKLPSGQYASLSDLVKDFLSKVKTPLQRAVFGVAGPVINGTAKITNLPWQMNEQQLQKDLSIPAVHLINDLKAMATAIPALGPSDLYTLNAGKPSPRSPLAVVAPGTGLGEAFLMWNGERYDTFSSEGGHGDFAPTNLIEVGLLAYMLQRKSHVSYEHVCSGIGLPNIYAYLKEQAAFDEPAWLREQMDHVEDITPLIVNNAVNETDGVPICVSAVKIFISILGAEAGNMALKVLSTGGVYLGGGIPPRILKLLSGGDFMQAFCNKGRFSQMLADVPVHVILNPKVALIGAASYGFQSDERSQ